MLGPGVLAVADCAAGLIWRVDLADGPRKATARVWLADDTMARDPDSGVTPPQPGIKRRPLRGADRAPVQHLDAGRRVQYLLSAPDTRRVSRPVTAPSQDALLPHRRRGNHFGHEPRQRTKAGLDGQDVDGDVAAVLRTLASRGHGRALAHVHRLADHHVDTGSRLRIASLRRDQRFGCADGCQPSGTGSPTADAPPAHMRRPVAGVTRPTAQVAEARRSWLVARCLHVCPGTARRRLARRGTAISGVADETAQAGNARHQATPEMPQRSGLLIRGRAAAGQRGRRHHGWAGVSMLHRCSG